MKILLTRKFLAITLIIFLAAFLFSYLAISLTPYGNVTKRVYSELPSPTSNDPSSIGGAWQSQLLFPQPGAGSMNVSRNTAIWIDEPRPVKIENLSLDPSVPITVKSNGYVFSAYTAVYPTKLLQPNTTYNVSAIVAGTPSWWIFTTSSEPSQPTFSINLTPLWVALTVAILVTLTVTLVILLQRRTSTRIRAF